MTEGSAENNTWELTQSPHNQYLYKCQNGELNGSSIVIVKEAANNQLYCTLSVKSDDFNIHSAIRPQMQKSCDQYILNEAFSIFHFRFAKNDTKASQFIACVDLITQISPMSPAIYNKFLDHANGNGLAMPSFFKSATNKTLTSDIKTPSISLTK
jgi:hypothetical protein